MRGIACICMLCLCMYSNNLATPTQNYMNQGGGVPRLSRPVAGRPTESTGPLGLSLEYWALCVSRPSCSLPPKLPIQIHSCFRHKFHHAMPTCTLCLHAMHAMNACMISTCACYTCTRACMHNMHSCILSMHIIHWYYACIPCMHTLDASMHARYACKDAQWCTRMCKEVHGCAEIRRDAHSSADTLNRLLVRSSVDD